MNNFIKFILLFNLLFVFEIGISQNKNSYDFNTAYDKSTIYEVESKVTQMDIAVVINASYIKELINDLKLTK